MRKLTLLSATILFFLLLSGCAGSYKHIYPPSLNFTNNDVNQGVSFSYRYDVLREKGNKKFARKETTRGVKLVAVKITNNYDVTLNIGRDLNFYSGENPITILDPYVAKQMLKQNAASYLLYLLMTPLTFNIINQYGQVQDSYPVGLVLGPGLALGNSLTAAGANKKLYYELTQYDVMGKDIRPGETLYGLIAISEYGYDPISLKLTGVIDLDEEIGSIEIERPE